MEILKIDDNMLKKEIANSIIRDLPDWFEVEDGIIEFINSMDDKTFYTTKVDNEYIGFFALAFPFENVCNLYVLGIKQQFRHQGIGTSMYSKIEDDLRRMGIKYVTVYTLSSKSDDVYYAQTRTFYKKLGFSEIYETTKIWDEKNPFLIMIKGL